MYRNLSCRAMTALERRSLIVYKLITSRSVLLLCSHCPIPCESETTWCLLLSEQFREAFTSYPQVVSVEHQILLHCRLHVGDGTWAAVKTHNEPQLLYVRMRRMLYRVYMKRVNGRAPTGSGESFNREIP